MGLIWSDISTITSNGKELQVTRAKVDGPHQEEIWHMWGIAKSQMKEDGISVSRSGPHWIVMIKAEDAETVCMKWRNIIIHAFA